ncbi:MAG: type I 3-dehydroquinate dehydratase [Lentisphaerae bacterium]|nr:type I 3-dehydroquinate dehydratase [Lentisphaerota bacterium]
MKKSFFDRQTTAVTALFSGESITELTAKARQAAADGADGIAVELLSLAPEFCTVDNFKAIIDAASLPSMFICYRNHKWFGSDDDARQECLLKAAEAGAEVIDVMGDLYCPTPGELTTDIKAVEKQKKLISEIHARGAKALISSHMNALEPKSAGEIMEIANIQSERGADICKIVTNGDTEEAFLEAIKADIMLSKSFHKPFIHLTSGRFCKLHRFMGTKLGLAITFGVSGYDLTPYTQPLVRSFKTVRDTIPWDITDIF